MTSRSKRSPVSLSYDEGEGGGEAVGGGGEVRKVSLGGDVEAGSTGRVEFSTVACFPVHGDNCAIAKAVIRGGSVVELPDGRGDVVVSHTILEGHRFAVDAIKTGDFLLSWQYPFGRAVRDIAPGDYVANERVLEELPLRVKFPLPSSPNFEDYVAPYTLPSEEEFVAGTAVAQVDAAEDEKRGIPRVFQGYVRSGGRGVGTRNYLLLLPTSSRAGSLARAAALRLDPLAQAAGLDGCVATVHTEAGIAPESQHNAAFVLRALAGWATHPNVGAVVILSHDKEQLDTLSAFLQDYHYPMEHTPHATLHAKPTKNFKEVVLEVVESGRGLLEKAVCEREECSVSALFGALQCGGSDAFSGVTANPLIGATAREMIRRGGSAVLAETDELVGAESWVLQSVRDFDTAQRFVGFVGEFRERLSWHGQTPEANPSGGNLARGLYNIAIKALGAAMKKPKDVRLEHVLDYAQKPEAGAKGYMFMNSPGNDIESIGGQVAVGSTVVFFSTGNGSVSNFPFVPTVKLVTTSPRFRMLQKDMDVDAGRFLNGTSIEEMGLEMFIETVKVASGKKTAGELSGRSQVQIWRNWPLLSVEAYHAEKEAIAKPLEGKVITVETKEEEGESGGGEGVGDATYTASVSSASSLPLVRVDDRGVGAGVGVGLVFPTSLCSGETARLIAEILAAIWGTKGPADSMPGMPHVPREDIQRAIEEVRGGGKDGEKVLPYGRMVALPHTEGCGSAGATELWNNILVGHALHPLVQQAVFLEHGCEKTHNDMIRAELDRRGIAADKFGWASVQGDGGIAAALPKVASFLDKAGVSESDGDAKEIGLNRLVIGLFAECSVSEEEVRLLAQTVRQLVAHGGVVIMPQTCRLLLTSAFLDELLPPPDLEDSLPAPTTSTPSSVVSTLPASSSSSAPTHRAQPSLPFASSPLPKGTFLAPVDGSCAGVHVMACPTKDWNETITGLAACGCHAMIGVSDHPVQGHPFVPLLLASSSSPDADIKLDSSPSPTPILQRLAEAVQGDYTPTALESGNVAWQVTRGSLGISL